MCSEILHPSTIIWTSGQDLYTHGFSQICIENIYGHGCTQHPGQYLLMTPFVRICSERIHTHNSDAFTHRNFYTQTLLHRDTFTHRVTDPFTHRRFYTQTLLHTDPFTQTLLHTDFFTHRRFYTETLLHTDAFTNRRLYTRRPGQYHAVPFHGVFCVNVQ